MQLRTALQISVVSAALFAALVLPATTACAATATVSITVRNAGGTVTCGPTARVVPVNGKEFPFQVAVGKHVLVTLTDKGPAMCNGGAIPNGSACATVASRKWQLDTRLAVGSGIALTDRLTIGVKTPGTLCECTSGLTILGCCGTKLAIFDGVHGLKQSHTMKYFFPLIEPAVPSFNHWGLGLLLLGLLAAGGFALYSRRNASQA